MDVISRLYVSLCRDKRKERFETILEPLQAITQLALLAFCPKGSKLSITKAGGKGGKGGKCGDWVWNFRSNL